MKRVLIVSPFPPYIGGVSISSERLFNNLIKDGYITDKYDVNYANKALNNYKILKLARFLFLPVFLLYKKQYNVIHFNISGSYTKYYVTLFRSFFSKKTKFITTIHGDVNNLLLEKLGKLCVKGFDLIICVKQGDKKPLSNYFKGKIIEIPAFIAPNSNNLKQLPKKVEDFFDTNALKIAFNGAVICNKEYNDLYGFMDVLELLNKLKTSNKNVRLFLINLGNKSGEIGKNYIIALKKYIENNHLTEFVYWYEAEPLDFCAILKKSDIYIRPTKIDGDALSIREALMLKVPTIASNVIERPKGTIVYNYTDSSDFYNKTKDLVDNYHNYKYLANSFSTDFYSQIKEQYEN